MEYTVYLTGHICQQLCVTQETIQKLLSTLKNTLGLAKKRNIIIIFLFFLMGQGASKQAGHFEKSANRLPSANLY